MAIEPIIRESHCRSYHPANGLFISKNLLCFYYTRRRLTRTMHDLLSVLLALLLATATQATKPPRDVIVIYPSNGANLGQNITFGIGELGMYDGLIRNISVALLAPNGSNAGLIWNDCPGALEHACIRGNGTSSGVTVVDQVGTYVFAPIPGVMSAQNPGYAQVDCCVGSEIRHIIGLVESQLDILRTVTLLIPNVDVQRQLSR